MTTGTSAKMPRLRLDSQARFANAMVRGTTATFTHHRHHIKTHKLPGIGTYVIDTPKDANLTAREKCFRYQEIHRGVSRSKLKSLPDIPKRYDMKTLPVAKLREIRRTIHSPFDEADRDIHTPNVSENGSNDDGRSDKSRKQDSSWKLPSQEELVSRSPIGRMESTITGFGVRKNKLATNTKLPRQHREFTYLSTNLALSEPEPVMVKATERELESQAEYRKQLTFYLSQMLNSENTTPQPDTKCQRSPSSHGEEVSSNKERDIPYDYVGYSSKNLNWERNLRLGDMLINTTPDLRKRLKLDDRSNKFKDSSGGKKENKSKKQSVSPFNGADNTIDNKLSGSCSDLNHSHTTKLGDSSRSNSFLKSTSQNPHQSFHIEPSSSNLKRSNTFTGQQEDGRRRATVTVPAGSSNKIEIVHHYEDGEEYGDVEDGSGDEDDDDDDDDDAEKWREVVNMPVVESGGYDRYANVKLPSWGRTHHPKGWKEQKQLVPSQASRNTSHGNTNKMGVSPSKNTSPS